MLYGDVICTLIFLRLMIWGVRLGTNGYGRSILMSKNQYSPKNIKMREIRNPKYVGRLLLNSAWGFKDGAYSIYDKTYVPPDRLCIETKDSRYLLLILALELFLKLLYLIDKGMLIYGHEIGIIFKLLDKKTQAQILTKLNSRRPGHPQNLCESLTLVGSNFTKIRYFFEDYANLSEEEAQSQIDSLIDSQSISPENAPIVYQWDLVEDVLSVVSNIAIEQASPFFLITNEKQNEEDNQTAPQDPI